MVHGNNWRGFSHNIYSTGPFTNDYNSICNTSNIFRLNGVGKWFFLLFLKLYLIELCMLIHKYTTMVKCTMYRIDFDFESQNHDYIHNYVTQSKDLISPWMELLITMPMCSMFNVFTFKCGGECGSWYFGLSFSGIMSAFGRCASSHASHLVE